MSKLFSEPGYFFSQGIYFQCQQCGRCCTGEPGTVYIMQQEMNTIAAFLNIGLEKLIADYLYPFRDSYSILEDTQGRCLFYRPAQGCLIYPVRPNQCRRYPFWKKNLSSRYRWKQISRECPGIGQGRLYSYQDILSLLQDSVL